MPLHRLVINESPNCDNKSYKDCLVSYENKSLQDDKDKQAISKAIYE